VLEVQLVTAASAESVWGGAGAGAGAGAMGEGDEELQAATMESAAARKNGW
jgi:hypothetical protein